jgi:hypothetical protein
MLRVACDLDGTLADLSAAYRRIEQLVQGDSDGVVWDAIRNTENFWTALDPIEPGVVARLQEMTIRAGWEVFFVTQRPGTAGESVQRQTQQWLIEQGFERPSVLTVPGSRGKAALALDLDFLIDDLPRNCVDVASDSRCRPVLVARQPDPEAEQAAARFRISVVGSVSAALDLIVESTARPPETTTRSARWFKKMGFG